MSKLRTVFSGVVLHPPSHNIWHLVFDEESPSSIAFRCQWCGVLPVVEISDQEHLAKQGRDGFCRWCISTPISVSVQNEITGFPPRWTRPCLLCIGKPFSVDIAACQMSTRGWCKPSMHCTCRSLAHNFFLSTWVCDLIIQFHCNSTSSEFIDPLNGYSGYGSSWFPTFSDFPISSKSLVLPILHP